MDFINSLHEDSENNCAVAYIGIDWADRKHDICLFDVQGQTQEFCVIEHRPEKIEQWVESIRKRYDGRTVAIWTEQKRGPLIYALDIFENSQSFP